METQLIGKKVILSIGEPWDFTTNEGENIFSGMIIEIDKNCCLIKVKSPFEFKTHFVEYVIGCCRYQEENMSYLLERGEVDLNIGIIDDPHFSEKRFEEIWKQSHFLLIGVAKL